MIRARGPKGATSRDDIDRIRQYVLNDRRVLMSELEAFTFWAWWGDQNVPVRPWRKLRRRTITVDAFDQWVADTGQTIDPTP